MAFGNQITFTFPAPMQKSKSIIRHFGTVADNEPEISDWKEVKETQNQLILHIQYIPGKADHLEYRILCRTAEDTVGYERVYAGSSKEYTSINIKPNRIMTAGNYEVALPLCCDVVRVQTAVAGDISDCQYGVKMIIGTA